MNLIMLSGNSLNNRDWILEAQAQLKTPFQSTFVLDYGHWATGQPNIDLQAELPKLAKAAGNLEPYGVFAKSIGTVLAVQAIEQGLIKPAFLLFCGIPLGYILSDYPQFGAVLARANLPLTFIHNQNDSVASSSDASQYLQSHLTPDQYHFIETPGNTHDYEDYSLLKTELATLLG